MNLTKNHRLKFEQLSSKGLNYFIEIMKKERNFNLNELNKLIINYFKIINQLKNFIEIIDKNLRDLERLYYKPFSKMINNYNQKIEKFDENEVNEFVNFCRIDIYINKTKEL